MAEEFPVSSRYRIEFSAEERSALIWALEVSRALLAFGPNLHVLLTDQTITDRFLDDLADRLFVVGCAKESGEAEPTN